MSHLYAGKLFAAYPGGAIERAVLAALALFMSHDDPKRSVKPAVDTLATLTGYAERRTREALGTLTRERWIEPLTKRKGGRSITTPYRVNVAMLAQFPDRTKRKNTELGAGFTPVDNEENSAPHAAFGDAKPCMEQPETLHETAENPAPRAAEQGFRTRVKNKGARSRAQGAATAARPQSEWMTQKDRQRADRQATLDAMAGPLRKPTHHEPTADDVQAIEVEYRRVPD